MSEQEDQGYSRDMRRAPLNKSGCTAKIQLPCGVRMTAAVVYDMQMKPICLVHMTILD